MKLKVMPAPEVAYVLRQKLGPIRAWEFTLADMRRGRVESVHGAILLPICMGKHEGAWRPMYATTDVVEFIRAVRAATPGTARTMSYQVKIAHTHPGDTRPWHTRKLPVAASTAVPMMAASMRAPGYLPV